MTKYNNGNILLVFPDSVANVNNKKTRKKLSVAINVFTKVYKHKIRRSYIIKYAVAFLQ